MPALWVSPMAGAERVREDGFGRLRSIVALVEAHVSLPACLCL